MANKLDVMYDLCEVVEKELEELNEKVRANGGQLGDREAQWLKELTESKVNLMCIIEELEEKEGSSGTHWDDSSMRRRSRERSPMRSNRSMENSRRSGVRRDSMGRYTRDDARMDFIDEAEELMNRAPDEQTRMKFERMLNELR